MKNEVAQRTYKCVSRGRLTLATAEHFSTILDESLIELRNCQIGMGSPSMHVINFHFG